MTMQKMREQIVDDDFFNNEENTKMRLMFQNVMNKKTTH